MEFKWLNESRIEKKGDLIEIVAPPETDYFCVHPGDDEISPDSKHDAPYYYTEVEGDFVLRVKAIPDFKDTYDASAVMIMKDLSCWAKSCFEQTDFGTRAVVSVVTNGASDDANGCNIDADSVWLQVCRVGNEFGMQYSEDGEHFYMMRYFYLPVDPVVKVGLVAQSPIGRGGVRGFEHFTIEHRTVENIRAGK